MDVITTHLNADFDTIASMLAACKLYPGAVCVLPGSQEETVKGFLVQSAFYNLPMRKPREIDLDKVTRLILVDIRTRSRIGIFGELVGRPGVPVHVYDHHPDEDADVKGDLEVIRRVGSTTTILVQILKERGIPITPDEATVMMLGIYEDTGSLGFPSTTVDDYLAAAHLLSCGAKLTQVSDILAKDLTSGQISLLYDLLQGTRAYTIRGVEVVIAEARREEYVGDLALLVHKLRDMEGVSILFAICQMGDRVVLVGRSRKPEVDAAAVMREFGGGGHAYAASATVKEMTTFQVREKILRLLEEKVIPRRTAADVMASPARTVDAGDTILEVHHALTRSNINAVPVMRERQGSGDPHPAGGGKGRLPRPGRGAGGGVHERRLRDGDARNRDRADRGDHHREEPAAGPGGSGEGTPRGHHPDGAAPLPLRHAGRGASRRRRGCRHGRGDGARKNVGNLMRDRLPARVLSLLRAAGECAERLGMKAFAVGGFVRDLVMRVDNLDVDIVVEGDGIRFAETFAEEQGARVRPHHKFGTAVLVFQDGFKIDVATARVEYYLKPAALPTVEYSSLKQDMYRRDFVINTLAVRLSPRGSGK